MTCARARPPEGVYRDPAGVLPSGARAVPRGNRDVFKHGKAAENRLPLEGAGQPVLIDFIGGPFLDRGPLENNAAGIRRERYPAYDIESVVFPAPLGSGNTNISPFSTSKETSFTAESIPKDFDTS